MQTFTVNLPAFSGQVPTVNGEADHFDGSTPAASQAGLGDQCRVRLPALLLHDAAQPAAGHAAQPPADDPGRRHGPERRGEDRPAPDRRAAERARRVLRHEHDHAYHSPPQGGTHEHNLRFADGTSACFIATQNPTLAGDAYAATTASIPVTDWHDGTTAISYPYATSPAVSAPLGAGSVTIAAPGATSAILGDWDTGPGFAPDGALSNLPDAGTTARPHRDGGLPIAHRRGRRRGHAALAQRADPLAGRLRLAARGHQSRARPRNRSRGARCCSAPTRPATRRIPASSRRPIISCSTVSGCRWSSRTASAPAWRRRARSTSTTRSRRSPICIAAPRCTRCCTTCAFPAISPIYAASYKSSATPMPGTIWHLGG